MSLAQKLYEEGYITYHRTDSVTISSSAVLSIINFVKKNMGKNMCRLNQDFIPLNKN